MSSNCRIYVGNLPQNIKKRDLEEIFDGFGPIQSVDIHDRYDPAFAFIEFDDPRDAEDAVYDKDGYRYQGQAIKVQFPRGSEKFKLNPATSRRPPSGGRYMGGGGGSSSSGNSRYVKGRGPAGPIRRSKYRVLVSGLPKSGSWQDLKDHMREAGEVFYTDVYKDGTGVVEYGCYNDVDWSVKHLDDSKFTSHENETSYIRVKSDQSPSRSRSRSPRRRSYSPRRSRSRSPRRSRSPKRSRSPRRSYSRSPRRRSFSPKGRSPSPRRRSRTP